MLAAIAFPRDLVLDAGTLARAHAHARARARARNRKSHVVGVTFGQHTSYV